MRNVLLTLCAIGVLAACDGSPTNGASNSGGAAGTVSTGASGGVGAIGATGGTGATDAGGNSDGGGDAATDAGADCEVPPPNFAPGTALTNPSTAGTGPCAGTTLGAFINAIHAAHPELSDITTIFVASPNFQDGTFIYPFSRPDGGFSVAMKRGSGDCPAGCMQTEYWYFDADAGCAPALIGHFKPSPGDAGCTIVEGEPMWGVPKPLDPKFVCNADLSPQNISGTYQFWACGKRIGCELTEGPFAGPVTVVVAQNPDDLSLGSVTLTGLGFPAAENVAIPATFIRRRFSAYVENSNLPSACFNVLHVLANYDFEGYELGGVGIDHMYIPDCSNPDKICGGSLSASWFKK